MSHIKFEQAYSGKNNLEGIRPRMDFPTILISAFEITGVVPSRSGISTSSLIHT